MKKTFIVTIDVDDEKVNGPNTLNDALGISMDRAKELAYRCVNDFEAAKKRGDEKFNGLAECLKMLEEDKLTGNELVFYIQGGYAALLNMKRAAMTSSLASLLGGL